MTRRGDPDRIYQAQRAGIFMHLVTAERLDQLAAEHWISRWEREAEATGRLPGSLGYWNEAWRWIAESAGRIDGGTAMGVWGDEPKFRPRDYLMMFGAALIIVIVIQLIRA